MGRAGAHANGGLTPRGQRQNDRHTQVPIGRPHVMAIGRSIAMGIVMPAAPIGGAIAKTIVTDAGADRYDRSAAL